MYIYILYGRNFSILDSVSSFQMLLEKLNGTKPVLADCTTIGDLTADENVTNSGNKIYFSIL